MLGTGINNLPAARRYLRNRWNTGELPAIVSRPGARFYVTARSGGCTVYLLGPYVSHMTALAAVPRARAIVRERGNGFAAVGTASRPDSVPTLLGR